VGGEINIKFRPKYVGLTTVDVPRVRDWWCRHYVAYQGAHSRRPLIVVSIDSSMIPARADGFLTTFPCKSL